MPLEIPFLLMAAPNGARRTARDHASLPMTPETIAATAKDCLDAGAGAVHFHARDLRDGRHVLDADLNRMILAALDQAVGEEMLKQVTTEAVGVFTPDQQMDLVRKVRPDAVSIALSELIPDDSAAVVDKAARFLTWMKGEGILPQFILYSLADIKRFAALRADGVIPYRPAWLQLVLGKYTTGQVSDPADLLPLASALEPGDIWSLCAFGRHEAACILTAGALGGHARIGFENNLHLADGTIAPNNAALIRQAVRGAALLGRSIATGRQAYALLSDCR